MRITAAHLFTAEGDPRCVEVHHFGTLGPVFHHGENPDGASGWSGFCGKPAEVGNVCEDCRENFRIDYGSRYGPMREWLDLESLDLDYIEVYELDLEDIRPDY